jgi:predicted nuclease of restriction endonuclease-like (RecB) superfamily
MSRFLARPPAAALAGYAPFLSAVKARIRAAQVRATLSANAELIRLYWDIGRAIDAMQQKEGWGAGVIPRLARDIANDVPEVKGFSERNIKLMSQFAREYPALFPIGQRPVAQLASDEILPQPVAKFPDRTLVQTPSAQLTGPDIRASLQQLAAKLPWGHHVLLLQKVKDLRARLWYVQQTKPTVGLILCQDKNRIVAEYALKGVKKAIGVSEYRLTRALPKEFRSSLPTVEAMEAELVRLTAPAAPEKRRKK